MIANFTIQNFGSFKNKQTLSFEAEKTHHLEEFYVTKINKNRLLKIALIYGANASGKTTVLQALDFLRNLTLNPASKKNEKLNFNPFLFDKETKNENSLLSIEFFQNEVKYFYEIEFNRNAVVREILKSFNPNKSTLFTRKTNIDEQLTEIKFGKKIKIQKTSLKALEANTLWNNTVIGGFLKTNIEIKELNEVSDWFKNYLSSVIYPNSDIATYITSLVEKNEIKKENILKILKKADLSISDIIIETKEENIPEELLPLIEKSFDITDNEIDKIKREKKIRLLKLDMVHSVDNGEYNLPFNLESQGTKRFYGFAGLLYLLIKKEKAFLIDELGSSLHPDLYQYFLLTFLINSKNSQIIASTHNREILNDKNIIRDDVIWITDKSKDSSTELYSFADFNTTIIRDTTNRLNAYKSGKLGGIPNLGDFYLDIE